MIRAAALPIAFAIFTGAQTPSTSPSAGISLTPVLDNETITVNRVRMDAGAAETIHTHPFSLLVVLLTSADVDRTLGDSQAHTLESAGSVWFAAKEIPHASRNAGKKPVDAIAIAIKPTRRDAPEAPATAAPPGITRTTLLDNADARVVRVAFNPDGREPVHTHPYDLLTIQLTEGRMDMSIGSDRTMRRHDAGFVQFVARDVPHAYANADTKSVELISVAIK